MLKETMGALDEVQTRTCQASTVYESDVLTMDCTPLKSWAVKQKVMCTIPR